METQQNCRLQPAPYLFVLLQGLIYGFGDPISKAAYEIMPVYSLLSLRYLLALLVMLLFAGRRILDGLRDYPVRAWLLPSLCMAGAYLTGNVALGLTAATSVAFLRSLPTIMTPVLAWVVLRRKIGLRQIPIQILVLVGLYLLCGLGGLSHFGMGEIFALLSALLLSGSLVFGETALEQMDPIALTGIQTMVTAIMATLCAFVLNEGWHLEQTSPSVWLTILYLAVPCSFLGIFLQNAALAKISSRTVALLQCLCPVMTAFFSRFLLGERLSVAGLIGAVLILACVAAETLIKEESI